MKKASKIVIITILLISLSSIFIHASGTTSYTFYYEDREITIEADHGNEEDAQIIADYIVYGILPAGYMPPENELNTPLLCILFGHSIETYTAFETIHNVYTTSPKCVENTYEIEHCTRSNCDYIQSTLIHTRRIATCHG